MLLWDNTVCGQADLQLEIASSASVLITHDIPQHTGVYSAVQTTLFTKTTVWKRDRKKKRKVTGNKAINACVPRRVPQLTTNGLGLSTKSAFYWALYLRDVQKLPQGRFWKAGSLETQRLFCCAEHVIYNQTCYCWLPQCNHINWHFSTWCTLDVVQRLWDAQRGAKSLALRAAVSRQSRRADSFVKAN